MRVRPERWHAIGVHIDPATLTVVSLDLAGNVQARLTRPAPRSPEPEEVVRLIVALSEEVGAELDPGSVLGIGVAAPGPIDVVAGRLHRPPQLPGWEDVPLRSELHRVTGWPVLLDKDVTAAVTGEHWSPEGTRGDFLYLYLGSGIAAGAVLNGSVHRGATNNVGEVGDMYVSRRRTDSDPRLSGMLHTTTMPSSLVRKARAADVLARREGPASAEEFAELCRLADTGHRGALRVLRTAARDLARGVATLVNFLDLGTVVMGGPSWPALAEHQLEVLQREVPAMLTAREDLEVRSSRLADVGAARGAAALVLDHFLAPRPSGLMME
nr:ROK family protein [Auraticoccus cholistanensis]